MSVSSLPACSGSRMSWVRVRSSPKLLCTQSFAAPTCVAAFSSLSNQGVCAPATSTTVAATQLLTLPSSSPSSSLLSRTSSSPSCSSSSSSSYGWPLSCGSRRGFADSVQPASEGSDGGKSKDTTSETRKKFAGLVADELRARGKSVPATAWSTGGSDKPTRSEIDVFLGDEYWQRVFRENRSITEKMWRKIQANDEFTGMMTSPYKMDPKYLDEISEKWYEEHTKHRGAEKAIEYAMTSGNKKDPNNIDNDVSTYTGIWRQAKRLMLWQCTEALGGSAFREALKEARDNGDGAREISMTRELNKKCKEWLHQHQMQARTMRYVDTNEEWQARRERTLKNYSYVDFERFQNFMQIADDIFWYMDDENLEDEKSVTAPNYLLFEGQEEERVRRQLQETDLRKIAHLLPEWWVIDEGRHVKRVAKGKIESFSVMVIAGDANGMAGWSVGKSKIQEEAKAKAIRGIRKNLMFLPLTESRTITSRALGKHEKTRVQLWPRYSGFGITAGFIPRAIFGCFGIEDITAKVFGNNHPRHQVWATFHGLAQQKSLREIAIDRGANVYNLFEWNPTYRPRPPTVDEMERRKNEVREMIVRMRSEHAWNNPRLDEGFAFSDKYLDNSQENTAKNVRPLLYSRHFRYADWLSSLKASGMSEEKIAEEVQNREKIIRPIKEMAFVKGIITKAQLEATGMPIELEDPIQPHATINPLTDDTIHRSSLTNRPTSPLNRALGDLYKGRGVPKSSKV